MSSLAPEREEQANAALLKFGAGVSVREALRQHTHDAHVRLHRHPLLAGITRPRYSLQNYQILLAANFHFYRAVEAAVERSAALNALGFSYAPRRKLGWLEQDLKFFGIDPDTARWAPRSAVVAPEVNDAGRLIGALYTVEGSSLGGAVISRCLISNLGLLPSSGGRYFFGYGDDVQRNWGEFEAVIARGLGDSGACEAATCAARSTFDLMEAVLDDFLIRLVA